MQGERQGRRKCNDAAKQWQEEPLVRRRNTVAAFRIMFRCVLVHARILSGRKHAREKVAQTGGFRV